MNFETFTEVFEYNINILENKKINATGLTSAHTTARAC
jgi:hypothetical protein